MALGLRPLFPKRWIRPIPPALLPLALLACATPTSDKLLPRFEAALAAQDSATAALEGWCQARGIADPAKIIATSVGGEQLPPTTRNRQMLEVSDNEPVNYRHVRLSCGGKVLSQAHNWYVPARLTAEMNHTLETTDTPFGRVVAPLGFKRERISSTRGGIEGCPADTVLHHRAVLRLPDGRPIATLIECYSSQNLR